MAEAAGGAPVAAEGGSAPDGSVAEAVAEAMAQADAVVAEGAAAEPATPAVLARP